MPFVFPSARAALATALLLPFVAAAVAQPDPLAAIDPRIGVIGAGSCVIGPTLPFGSIHPSPDTPDGGYDGYHPDRPIRGFSQTHVSGTGWGQYGTFLVSPQIGLATVPGAHESPKADEKIEAHQYQVRLTRYDIQARLTPAHRSAIYRFTFPASDQAHVVLNATHHIPADIALGMSKWQSPVVSETGVGEDGRSLHGKSRFPGGFGGPYTAYFYAEFDRAPTASGVWRGDRVEPGVREIKTDGTDTHVGTYLRFDTRTENTVTMKIAVSFHSVEKAREALRAEIPAWDYGAVLAAAAESWRDTLASLETRGGDAKERVIFNTAIFHAHQMPRDRRGEFARFAPDAPMWDDHYALWDTWRTLYPLYAFVRPDVVRYTVASFIERQRVDGVVADTFIAGENQLREQGGNAVDMVIGDAHAKNIRGIDWEKAYGVLKHNADHRRTGPSFDKPGAPAPYRELGWIPSDVMSCSMTLEYSYNDYVAAQLARSLGHADDATRYLDRSRRWENLWNPAAESDGFTGFIMPRAADGAWVPFDLKKFPGSWKLAFYEANSWTYSYFAPHQIGRLVELMGGRERFLARLEHALNEDLLELSNEPSFLIPQLFHYVGRPDLSAKWLRRITDERFTLKGYPGDDDSGAMSSYYIWSRLGLFPNAGQDLYYLNGPAFDHILVRRPEQGSLEISRSGEGIFVAGVKLNGRPLARSWLRHAELDGPSKLEFTMSRTPTDWARNAEPPYSLPALASGAATSSLPRP